MTRAPAFPDDVGAAIVWSSTNELEPTDEMLPAASVATTDSPTVPSGRPAAGIVPELGVAEAVLIVQLPLASAVVV